MKKCIKLAQKAQGCTSPNPLVGCIVLNKNGEEISSGYHKKCGQAHAEAEALGKLKNNEAKNGTIFVNLEPCSHHGKTPPCADLIIKHGIKTLVVGMQDPNPIVAGRGLTKCKNAGINVITGILEQDAFALNEIFIKNMTEKKPFVALKTATTTDGKIATKNGDSKWITGTKARQEVQKIRKRYDSILTSSSTVLADDPSMNCRLKNAENPVKIIIDRTLKTNFNAKIYKCEGEKIYIAVDEAISNEKLSKIPSHIQIIKCPSENNKINLEILLQKLFQLGICSLLVEAGSCLAGSFITQGLVDKVYHFIAPKITADDDAKNAFSGRSINKISETLNFQLLSVKKIGTDALLVYKK